MASGFILLFAEYLSERRAFAHMYIFKYYTEYVSIKNNSNETNSKVIIIKGSLAEKLPIYERHPSQVKVK